MNKLKIALFFGLIALLFCLIIVVGVVIFCEPANDVFGPDSGVWHCKEVGIQISFEKEYPSMVFWDGKYIICTTRRHRGAKHISVICQVEVDKYHLGESLFNGKFVDFDNNKYVLRDTKSRKLYVFEPGELVIDGKTKD